MEKCERGSISLYLLVVALLMTLLTHMALLWLACWSRVMSE